MGFKPQGVKTRGAVNRILTWLTAYTQGVVEHPPVNARNETSAHFTRSAVSRAAYSSQLERILASNAFRHTEVLKRLLEYLGREALTGEGRDLKEYTVGVEAFGKPPDYDPKIDSSVRVQTGKLRHKLDEYYRTQGVNDPILIELPKGHFKLEFYERPSAAIDPRSSPKGRHLLPWSIAAVAILWAALTTTMVVRSKSSEFVPERYSGASIEALWSPLLESRRPAIISLGTPLFAKISGDFFRTPVLNDWKSFAESEELKRLEKRLGGQAVPAYPYTGIGEASAAFELARLFTSGRKEINLVLSSALSWEDVGRNNVIFVGPPKFNLYESDLPVQQDFIIRHGRLENLRPVAGEASSFSETWSKDQSTLLQGYALIARLPGLHGAGYILELASTSTEGTRVAVEYVTRPQYAEQLVHTLRESGNGIPKYFEAVVRARFRSQTPIQIEQIAVHVLR